MSWVIVVLVVFLYVHLFNALAKLHFESGEALTLRDLWRRFLPPMSFRIEL